MPALKHKTEKREVRIVEQRLLRKHLVKSRALLVHEDESKLLVALKLAEARQYVFAVADPEEQ